MCESKISTTVLKENIMGIWIRRFKTFPNPVKDWFVNLKRTDVSAIKDS